MPDDVARSAAKKAALIAVPAALLAGVLTFWLLGGLRPGTPGSGPDGSATTSPPGPQPTTAVSMSAAPLAPSAVTACRTLIANLPDTLRDLVRRPVSAGAEQNAAYGQPPLTVACGSTVPSIAPDATVYVLSGVCWYAASQGGGTAWTTLDRTVPVTVTVPAAYQQPGQWVIEFSPPVATAIPAAHTTLPGCQG